MYFLYILECENGFLYTGITTDIQRRFKEHATGKGGHFTRSHKVIRMRYSEQHPDRASALRREAEIKKWSREKKLTMIQESPA